MLNERFEVAGKNILEIGCNDGFLLSRLAGFNAVVKGLDASSKMVSLAKSSGVDAEVSIVGGEDLSAQSIQKKYDLIIANNVVNHSDKPREFMAAVSQMLGPNGTFIFEQPYWGSTVDSLKLDQVYHEHISYFSLKSIASLLSRSGMYIYDFDLNIL